ncbi:LOW QUALITY PROTEIN: hypothetical protein U9M48_034604, partial [Paspalum notatum var. saurae]
DRLSTRELLKRKKHPSTFAPYALKVLKNQHYTFLFTADLQRNAGRAILNLQGDQESYLFQNLDSFKQHFSLPFFMEILIIMTRTIWTIRNNKIFKNIINLEV